MPSTDQQSDTASDSFEAVFATAFVDMNQGFCLLEQLPTSADKPTDFRLLQTNPAFEKLTGLKQVVGETIRQWMDPAQAYIVDYFDRAALRGQPICFEHYVAALDRWLTVDAFRLKPVEPYWIGVLFDDITQRKKTEAQQAFLLKLSDALRPLADASQIQEAALHCLGQHLQVDRVLYAEVEADNAHFVITANYVRNNFSPMIGRFQLSDFGKTPDSQRLGQTLVVADIHQVDEAVEHLNSYRDAGVVSLIGIPLRKGGRWVASLTVHHGQPRQWTAQEVALVEETAERTWAALERARAEQALRREDKRKDEFMAMLGHELRNPLALLSHTLLYLEVTQGQDEQLSYPIGIQRMSRQVRHLGRMVDDLLDVSRIRQGKIRLQRQPTELGSLVEQTVEAAHSLFGERRQSVAMTLAPWPIVVNGDATRLSQVVMNLLTNAAKYTPEGGHVWITLEQQDHQAVLTIRDDGMGIPADELSAIFEVFVQGNTSLDRPHGGLGLGLAVVKQIVAGHQGHIDAYSPGPRQGSTFTLRLPVVMEKQTVLQPAVDPSRQTRDNVRVLLVDDNKELIHMMGKIMQLQGYEVHLRYSGQEGIAAAEALAPDVMLVDIGMPTMDGYAVCHHIRRQAWGKNLPMIALTGFGQEADKQRSWAAGFDEHLLKPVDHTRLADVLSKTIAAKKASKSD